jgi:hypothetical protein
MLRKSLTNQSAGTAKTNDMPILRDSGPILIATEPTFGVVEAGAAVNRCKK